MPDPHRNWNDLGPAIDRLFRSIEMLAVTALVGVVVSPYGEGALSAATLSGTLLAIIYLTEPVANMLADKALGEKREPKRLVLALSVIFLSLVIAYRLTPLLTVIPANIARTINLNH
jgi:hypothetical protein